MAYDSRAIANSFLDLSSSDPVGISPMKLQKLVYFAHGWNLALASRPLIFDPVEAWEYGPVVRRLYAEFRKYGDKRITDKAAQYMLAGGSLRQVVISIGTAETDSEYDYTKRLLARIWETYGKFTAIQLSNISHDPEGPWFKARQTNRGIQNPVIDDEEIGSYFRSKLAA